MNHIEHPIRLREVYTTKEDNFSVVSVIQENTDEFVFLSYDELGRKDSLICLSKKKIKKISSDTEYLKKVTLSIEYWDTIKNLSIFPTDIKFCDERSYLMQALEYALKNRTTISIRTINSENIELGLMQDILSDSVLLSCISLENAKEYDTLRIPIKDIWFIEFDGCQSRILTYVNDHLSFL